MMVDTVIIASIFIWFGGFGPAMKWATNHRLMEWDTLRTAAFSMGWPVAVPAYAGWRLWCRVRRTDDDEARDPVPPGLGITVSGGSWVFDEGSRTLPQKPQPEARTAAQPIRAYRQWDLVLKDGEPMLESLARRVQWEGPILRADAEPHFHTKPGNARQLGHGIYAYPLVCGPLPSRGRLSMRQARPSADGEVELMGRVVRHTFGYRAEVARVVRLWVRDLPIGWDPAWIIGKLETRYQCGVGLWADPVIPEPEDAEPDGCTCDDCEEARAKRCGHPPTNDGPLSLSTDDLRRAMRLINAHNGRHDGHRRALGSDRGPA